MFMASSIYHSGFLLSIRTAFNIPTASDLGVPGKDDIVGDKNIKLKV